MMLCTLALAVPLALADGGDPLQAVLDAYVDASGRVDYQGVKSAGALDSYLSGLASAALPSGNSERAALWINAYNALTIDLVADNWPIASIRDLDGGKVWDTRKFVVAGTSVTLNDIEHKRLRPMGDERVHAALNCASIGCPPLSRQVYHATNLSAQLDTAMRAWVHTNAVTINRSTNTVSFNNIFDWYSEDFAGNVTTDIPGVSGKAEAAAATLAPYTSTADADFLRKGGYSASWITYDWGVNSKR
jgi:Protein of unknown function, DUF547